MVAYKKVVDELQWVSDRISTQIRTIGLGLIILTWGLIIGQPEIAGPIPASLTKNLLIIGVVALGTMFCDFLQYFFAYLNSDILRKKMEIKKLDEADYDYTAATYKLRTFFFWSKQVLLFVACIWFLIVIIPFCVKAALSSGP